MHADLRIGPLAQLAVGHERDDARQVGLVGDGQQVVHQRHVFFERLRNADWQCRREARLRAVVRLGPLDSAFDLADVVEILVEPRAIARAELALQLAGLLVIDVEDAQVALPARVALLRCAGRDRTCARRPHAG